MMHRQDQCEEESQQASVELKVEDEDEDEDEVKVKYKVKVKVKEELSHDFRQLLVGSTSPRRSVTVHCSVY